jgi:hypothetical protein
MHRLVRFGCLVLLVVASGSPEAAAGPVFHKPRVPVEAPPGTTHAGWASSNWSGYARSGSGFASVTGRWTVQAVAASSHPTYSSQWVGVDGFNNSDLIQTGTESDFVNGAAHYDAWWEILPAAETVITSITVHPGDHMSASVQKGTGTSWTIKISDLTTGRSFSTVRTYTGPRTSAEWIEEAPTVGGRIATLANYGLTTFDPGTINGGANPKLASTNGGVMVQKGVQVSTPSSPDSDTDGFNMRHGSTVPAPPPT